MRILSVSAQKPFGTGSGVYLSELVRGFRALGHEQAVVAGLAPGDAPVFPRGVGFYPVLYRSPALPFPVAGMSDEMPYESTRYRDMTPEMLSQFKAAFGAALDRAVEEFRPDLILCHHLYLLTALCRARFPGVPVAGICHGTDLRQLQKHPLERAFISAQIAALDRIFVLHGEQARAVAALTGAEQGRIAVIGSGFNDGIFHPSGAAPTPGRIIFAGKISVKKGVASLLRSMAQVPPPAALYLAGGAGDAAEYARIRALAEDCPRPVSFLGPLPQDELAREFCKSDVFVLPSFFEGLPLVVLEALSCGAKAVCTDLPGIRPWLDRNVPGHGVGFVPPPAMRDTDEPLAQALPAFEAALAAELRWQIALPPRPAPAMEQATWRGVCARLLDALA